MKTKTPSTAQDALLAEILGDVGKLTDQVKTLPSLVNSSIVEIHKAAVQLESVTEQHITAFQTGIAAKSEAQKEVLLEDYRQSLQRETTVLLRQITRQIAEKNPVSQRPKLIWVLAWLGGCLIASLGGIYSAHALYFDQIKQQAEIGHRVITVWDELPATVKKRIIEAGSE